MKSKHDVKYLITAMMLSVTTSATLSATETANVNNEKPSSPVIQTPQPITVIETTDKVDIPTLAEPKAQVSSVKEEPGAPVIQTPQPLAITETTAKVDTPTLAEPAAQVSNVKEKSEAPVIQTPQPLAVTETTDKDDAPALAEPAAQVSNVKDKPEAPVIQTPQSVAVIETTDKDDAPALAEPTAQESNAKEKIKNDNIEIETVVEAETKNILPATLNDAMPIAENKVNNYIPLFDGAIIFANIDDDLPAIANYYVQASEQEIIDFYQVSFGNSISQERKHGRLTLLYQADDLIQRVVISEQDGKHQVDVIVEKTTK